MYRPAHSNGVAAEAGPSSRPHTPLDAGAAEPSGTSDSIRTRGTPSFAATEVTPLIHSEPESAASSVRRKYTDEVDQQVTGAAQPPWNGAKNGPSQAQGGQRSVVRQQSKTLRLARKIKRRSKYYIPVTEWLPQYSWQLWARAFSAVPVCMLINRFGGDLVSGVSVACLLVPQAMSYASGLSKLNPVAGLWTAAIPALIYGALGTCRQLSMGPEASLSLMIGGLIQNLVYSDTDHMPAHPEKEAMAIALMVTFLVGVITSILGILRLGFLDVVLSRPLLRGFVTAVGVIIFIEQMVPMLGMTQILSHPEASRDPPTLPLAKAQFILEHLSHTHRLTAVLGFSALAVLIVVRVSKQWALKRPGGLWVRFVPEILFVVVGTTIMTGYSRWDKAGVEVLGKVEAGTGMPFGMPLNKQNLKYLKSTFPTAFVCAIVGLVDSIVAARENGSKYGYVVSPNRELVALGAANLGASLIASVGAVPAFGSITRSRLNGLIGSRSQMASIITSIIIILSIYFLLPYLYFLPKTVLSAIIVMVVYATPHEILFLWRMRAWTDFLQMTGTFVLTLCFSMETGLVASVIFSLILVIQNSTQTRIKIIGRLPNTNEWVPIDEDEDAREEIPGVLVVRIRENLNFANTGQLKDRLRRLELYGPQKSHPSDEPRRESAKALILHMGDVEAIDASALQILYELTKSYDENGVGVHFAHLRPAHVEAFRLVGIADMCGPTHFHRDLRDAMKEIESMGYGTSILSQF